ncbi:accessory factor UbiK family protein [Gammaproteobacteria bacterium]|nr:accessory factor UbiK family protein [Gammaproteobacteria bacterium]
MNAIERLLDRIAPLMPQGLNDDLRNKLRSGLQAAVAEMDLVTREEFETQRHVLLRTRERLEAIERQLAATDRPDETH